MPHALRVLVGLLAFASATLAEEWTRFRGPNGTGISAGSDFPTELSSDKSLVWRTAVKPGKSSPVLSEGHVFLTGFEKGRLFTQCFDRVTGKMVWERSEERPREEQVNKLNHPAAISPVTDGTNVYVFFKEFGLVSYDPAGRVRWRAPLGPFTNTMGLGSSPILAGDSIILEIDQIDNSYIAAFDLNNGELRWKISRNEIESWGTPLYYHPAGLPPQILTASRGQFGAHLLSNGKRVLNEHGLPTTIVGSPVLINDVVYVFGYGSDTPAPFSTRLEKMDKNKDGRLTPDEYTDDAFLRGIGKYSGNRDGIVTKDEWDAKQKDIMGPNCLMAIQLEPDGKGAIQTRELWRYQKSFTAVIPTLLHYRDVLYVVKNGGILTSFNAANGDVLKTARVSGGGGFSASPVAADGKIYLASEDGAITVLKASGQWEILATADLGEPIYATPALSSGSVFIRTDSALYRFANTN